MKIKNIVLAAFFIALGILLPMAFHSIPNSGSIFLPMHIAILLAGCFLTMPYAVLVAVITPVASFFLTKMPPLDNPVFINMIPELIIYAAAINLFYSRLKWNINFSLVAAMVLGRIAAGLAIWILISVFGISAKQPVAFVTGAVVLGLPGIVIQLLLIPTVVFTMEKVKTSSRKHAKR